MFIIYSNKENNKSRCVCSISLETSILGLGQYLKNKEEMINSLK